MLWWFRVTVTPVYRTVVPCGTNQDGNSSSNRNRNVRHHEGEEEEEENIKGTTNNANNNTKDSPAGIWIESNQIKCPWRVFISYRTSTSLPCCMVHHLIFVRGVGIICVIIIFLAFINSISNIWQCYPEKKKFAYGEHNSFGLILIYWGTKTLMPMITGTNDNMIMW